MSTTFSEKNIFTFESPDLIRFTTFADLFKN